ncbi:hypothetical protein L211DRAFT_833702 [Terfezia boudieri ATCC MYA-4762]|uniref:Secreted protein n=1 Tax=Terfezia boudieri ATCC MYA-4762 TaxID=1051890 RepID=A0A3N4M0L3_9PEZI|nr:hypothetical protein L211DRAFT_833702 [Terfezia boudieri ATCC MYA-4762]
MPQRNALPFILLFLPAGSQWLQLADRGVEFRRNDECKDCLCKAVSARLSLQHYKYSLSNSPYSKRVRLTSLRNVLEKRP